MPCSPTNSSRPEDEGFPTLKLHISWKSQLNALLIGVGGGFLRTPRKKDTMKNHMDKNHGVKEALPLE